MTNILKISMVVIITYLLSGCEYIKVATFDENNSSGKTEENEVTISWFSSESNSKTNKLLDETKVSIIAGKFPKAANTLENCGIKFTKQSDNSISSAAADPIVGTVVVYAVGQALSYGKNKLQSKITALQKASTSDYSAKIITPDFAKFKSENSCIALLRDKPDATESDKAKSGLVLVLSIEPVKGTAKPVAFQVIPKFLQANTARAITEQGEPISISVAISGKQIRLKDESPVKEDFASGVFKIAKVPIGEPISDFPNGMGTGLLPMPHNKAQALEITIAVTETGSSAIEYDKANAELDALEKAIGPVIQSELEKRLKPAP